MVIYESTLVKHLICIIADPQKNSGLRICSTTEGTEQRLVDDSDKIKSTHAMSGINQTLSYIWPQPDLLNELLWGSIWLYPNSEQRMSFGFHGAKASTAFLVRSQL